MKFLLCLVLCIAAAQAALIGGGLTYSAGIAPISSVYGVPLAYSAYSGFPTTYSAGLGAPALYSTGSLNLGGHLAYAGPTTYSGPSLYSTLLKK